MCFCHSIGNRKWTNLVFNCFVFRWLAVCVPAQSKRNKRLIFVTNGNNIVQISKFNLTLHCFNCKKGYKWLRSKTNKIIIAYIYSVVDPPKKRERKWKQQHKKTWKSGQKHWPTYTPHASQWQVRARDQTSLSFKEIVILSAKLSYQTSIIQSYMRVSILHISKYNNNNV